MLEINEEKRKIIGEKKDMETLCYATCSQIPV